MLKLTTRFFFELIKKKRIYTKEELDVLQIISQILMKKPQTPVNWVKTTFKKALPLL
jgi:hypothetical protein